MQFGELEIGWQIQRIEAQGRLQLLHGFRLATLPATQAGQLAAPLGAVGIQLQLGFVLDKGIKGSELARTLREIAMANGLKY